MTIDDFKKGIRCYRYYSDRLREAQERIEDLWYRLEGVKGISYDKIPSAPNETAISEAKHAIREQITEETKKADGWRTVLGDLDAVLFEMEEDTRDAVIDIYINRKRYTEVARRHYLSKSGLEGRINRELLRILKGQK